MKFKDGLRTAESRKALIEEYPPDVYAGVNEETGETVMVITDATGMEIHTAQDNGWTRINYYGITGHAEGETYKK